MNYPKKALIKVGKDFCAREFDCPCAHCSETLIDEALVSMLDILRDKAGRAVFVTSGYRCAGYQDDLRQQGYETAKGISQHELGKAADIKVQGLSGAEIEALAAEVGFKSIGVGKAFCHLDLRQDKERRWTYRY